MATADKSLENRVVKLETHIETERPHLATKADLRELETGLVKWIIGIQIAAAGVMIHLHNQQIAQIQTLISNP